MPPEAVVFVVGFCERGLALRTTRCKGDCEEKEKKRAQKRYFF